MIFRIARCLSIDIVAGSVGQLYLFSVVFDVGISWPTYFLLASTIWMIYTADHLLDALTIQTLVKERYLFHRKHKVALITAEVVLLITNAILLFHIPRALFISGVVLATFSVFYLLLSKSLGRFGAKEFVIAVIYGVGIFLPIMIRGSFHIWGVALLCMVILAFVNLLIIAYFERDLDRKEKVNSLANSIHEENVERIIFISISLLLALIFLSNVSVLAFYFSSLGIIYMLVFSFHNWSAKFERYRIACDGVFLLSFLYACMIQL